MESIILKEYTEAFKEFCNFSQGDCSKCFFKDLIPEKNCFVNFVKEVYGINICETKDC